MLDKYLSWRFDWRDRNCFDLARAVWLELTGVDLLAQTPKDLSVESLTERSLSVVSDGRLEESVIRNPCLVLFQRDHLAPHIGVYTNGSVIHLCREGCFYQPLVQVSAMYSTTRFYINRKK